LQLLSVRLGLICVCPSAVCLLYKLEIMLTRCVEATTAMTPQEIPTVDLCSDILERLFLRILVGMMRRGAISASRIEQLDCQVKWKNVNVTKVMKRRRTGRECSVSDIVNIMRQL
jgi:hypothetical protein